MATLKEDIYAEIFDELSEKSSASESLQTCCSRLTDNILKHVLYHSESAQVYRNSAKAIEEYDRRKANGEDMSGQVMPRMPGGSAW